MPIAGRYDQDDKVFMYLLTYHQKTNWFNKSTSKQKLFNK